MKTLSHLSSVFLGAALLFTPALASAQKAPSPETAIPRHTSKGGHGNFVPPRDRKLPPDPHRDIPAHPNQARHARNTGKAKDSSAENNSKGPADGNQAANPQ
ncbi:MAG TPA: hypothetical protein VGS10_17370 [Terracidiphilus sp.]|nr:hypothetical protein [Terracidiphilus sp.]